MDNDGKEGGRKRVIQTLSCLSSAQIAAVRSMPPHQAPIAPIKASRPIDYFLGQSQFDLEQRTIFKRLPVPIAMSALLPDPGQVLAVDSYGPSILLTRDSTGNVHAFLNACSHKGSALVLDNEARNASRLVCPYHAWTYGLDGKLIGVPRSETFDGLCREHRPLTALPSREIGGVIWVGLTPGSDPDFTDIETHLSDDFTALRLGEMHAYGRHRFELKANWKLVLEPFLESYHVRRLHANSVGQLFADINGNGRLIGRNIRQISGKANFDPNNLDDESNVHKSITIGYTAFPNLVLITSPYYISMMILAPVGPARTIVDYVFLVEGKPDNPRAHELYEKSYKMALQVFGEEDYSAAEWSQRGLSMRPKEEIIYGGMEEIIPRFYAVLDEEICAALNKMDE